MRLTLPLILFASAAQAWEFTPGLPCLLSHETSQARIELTYDPTQPLYSLTISRAQPWAETPSFGMRFDGPHARAIGTGRHVLNADRSALTVTDRGFGNVLDGLQYNHTATAIAGDVEIAFPLEGAAGPVAAFRACEGVPLAS
ncbi:hypothetical protein [Roseovarius sp. 2305UL8-3]|uniref:hypothetical protein n=1 Tax=Roseovarius conchicola TaxID=3121636 RepID=UPI00352854BF